MPNYLCFIMSTAFSEYYLELQRREGLDPIELVAEWDAARIAEISEDFRAAALASKIIEQVVPLRVGSSNQSVGNQVAEFFALQFPPHLVAHDLRACPGAGYPDKTLVRRAGLVIH